MSRSLDDLITTAAAELMAATATSHVAISERVLAGLVEYFGVDFGFLRHNDHTIHATVLVASWPPRENVPDPDPIGVVYFADADSVFAMAENLEKPGVLRPEPANADYQHNIEAGTGIAATSLAVAPLLSGDVTTGLLGFVKFGDRDWIADELNALQTIGTLFAQVQARIVAEEQVRYLAEHDDLTGLLNRRSLIAHLDDRLAPGQPGPVSILCLDLDRFKIINDHLGQNAGDAFIVAAAEILHDSIGIPAAIARFLGDAFVVVPEGPMSVEAAEALALRLQHNLGAPVVVDGEVLTRTVSIGVASGLPGPDSASTLLRRVDQATRSAKSSGGSAVAAFNAEMSANDAIRAEIELQMEGIIESHSSALVLHYLPEFDMRTGETLGAEALIRWQHPSRGLLLPDSFLSVVESVNLAAKLGRLVIRSACAQFQQWRTQGLADNSVLRVNVSPAHLVADGIVDTVTAALKEFDLDPRAVCLEITESVLVQDIDATGKTLRGLKDLGVQIAVDDFGTGYSAFTYLKSLPVDVIKIDKEFVRDLDTNPRDLAIVRSIVTLANGLGLDVVAEGVEIVAAAEILLDLGCYRAQGFLLSPPLEADQMAALLQRRFISTDPLGRHKVPKDPLADR